MSKRSYPSGSEKRKKALHQKEVIEKLPKLTSYFTTTTGETSVSSNQLINVPHDDSAQLQIAGISKPSCSNFEKEIESESDYSYDESATTSVTSLKPTTPTVSIEQQFSNTEELISHDPADYFHEKFVEINREILIRKGPVYFQNKDSDFSEASRTYKDGNKLVTRYFNKALFIRKLKNNESVERKWLLYSPSKCSVFCFSCCLFNPTDVNLCSRNGCNDWKHINHIILTHENSPAHKQSMITYLARSKAARETRDEALSLSRKMRNLEFIILTEIWSTILERIDKTSNYLQKETITLDVATNLLTSLYDFITNLRDKFDNFESSAKENNPESDYKDLSQRTRRRSSRQSFFDGSAPSVQLNGKERFNVETFLPIIDTLSVHLKQRQSSYEIVSQRFSLFFHLKTLNSEEIRQGCKEFSQIYHEDVNEKERVPLQST
ncbi:hypothetical protein ACJJTC_006976 [Scirpophaga incertulas]